MCIKYSISKTIFVIKSQSLLFRIQHFFLKEQRSRIKMKILNWNQIFPNFDLLFQHILRNNQKSIRNIGVSWFYFSSIVFMNSKKEFLTLSFLLTKIFNISNFTKFLNNLYFFPFNIFNYHFLKKENNYNYKLQTIFPFFFISKALFHKFFEMICLVSFPIILYKIQNKLPYKSTIVVQSLSYTNTYDLDCSYINTQDKNQIRHLIHKNFQFDNKDKKLIQKNDTFYLNHQVSTKVDTFANQSQIYKYIQSKNNILNKNILQIFTNKVFHNGNLVLNRSKVNSNSLFQEFKINQKNISISNLYVRLYKKQSKNLFDIKNYNKQRFYSFFFDYINFSKYKKSIYNSVYLYWNIVTTHNKFIHNLFSNSLSEIIHTFSRNHYINKQPTRETYKIIFNSYARFQKILQKIIHKNIIGHNKYVSFIILQLEQKRINFLDFENWKVNTFETILTNWYKRVNSKLFKLEQNWIQNPFVMILPKMNGSNFKGQISHFEWLQTLKQYLTQIPLSQIFLDSFRFHLVFLCPYLDNFKFPIDLKIEQIKKFSWIDVNKTYTKKVNSFYLEINKNVANDLIQHTTNSQLTYQIIYFVYESKNKKQLLDSKMSNKLQNLWVSNSKLSNLLNIKDYIFGTRVFFKEMNCILFNSIFKQQKIKIYSNQILTKYLNNLFPFFSNFNERYFTDFSVETKFSFLNKSLLISSWNNHQDLIQLSPQNTINHSLLFIPAYFKNKTLSSTNYELTNWQNHILSLNQKKFSFVCQSKVRYRTHILKNQLSSFYNKWNIKKANNSFEISQFFEIYKPWFFTVQFFEIYKPWFFTSQSLFFLKQKAIQLNTLIFKKLADNYSTFSSLFSFPTSFITTKYFPTDIYGLFFFNINKIVTNNQVNFVFWEQIPTNTYSWKEVWKFVDFKSHLTNEQILLLIWFSILFFFYYHCFSTFIGSSYLCLWFDFEYNKYLLNPSKNLYKLVHLINKPISLQSNLELNENRLIPNLIIIPYILFTKFLVKILRQQLFINQIPFDIFKTQKNNAVQFLISKNTLFEEIPLFTKMKDYGFPFKKSLNKDVNYFRLLNHDLFFLNNTKLFTKNISFHSKHLFYLFYSTNTFNFHSVFQNKHDLQYPFCKPFELATSSISLELEYLLSRAILVIGAKDTGKSYLIKKLASNITTSFIHICRQNLFSIKIPQETEDTFKYIRIIKKHILKRIDFIFHLSTILSPSIVWIPSIHEFCTPFIFQKTSIENGFLLRSLISTISSSSNVHFQNKIMFIGSTDNCQQLDPSFLGFNIFHKLIHVRIPTSIQRVKNLATVLQNQHNILKETFFHIELETNTMIYTFKDIQGVANEILLINRIQNQHNINSFTIHVALYRHLYGILNVSVLESESTAFKIGNMFLSYMLIKSLYQIQGDIWKTRFYYLSKICIELPIAKSTITEFMILSSIFKYLAGSSFRDIWLLSFQTIQNHMFGLQKEIKHDMKITFELFDYLSHKIMTSDIFNIQYQKSVSFGSYERTYDFNILNKIALKFDTSQNTFGQSVDNEFVTNSFLFTNCHKLNSSYLSKYLTKSNRTFYLDFWINKSSFNQKKIEYTKKDTFKNYLFLSLFKQNEQKSKSFLPNMILSKKEPYRKRKKSPIFDKQLQMRNNLFEDNEIQEFLDFQNTDTINDNYFYFFLNRVKMKSKKTISLYFPEYLFDNFIQKSETDNTFQSLNFVYCKYQYQIKNRVTNCDSTQNLHAIVEEIYYYLLRMYIY
uniref:Cell division protein n=1 Tax=Cylindrocystis brebissonii TaxID=102167 RepID=A0A191T612_9VIRI|nr:cell division protein [Cylindrocystis brebissonii]ANI25835.1 cell division protein [Cylindrocystis brebissonii]